MAAGSATCGVLGEVAVRECSYIVNNSCPFGIIIQNTGAGNTGNISYTPAGATPLWAGNNFVDQYTCPAKNAPACTATLPIPPCPDGVPTWDTSSCSWYCQPLGYHTPIIIDTDGSGFHLTSAQNGIFWDFYGNSQLIQMAWTAPGSTNGWLALPNQNGQITSARQLFSNISAQPGSDESHHNGFNSLSIYDTNGDGVINAEDNPWWEKLRVWIDTNHNGIVDSGELRTLDALGITGISLAYTHSPKTDQYGNQFKLKGTFLHAPDDRVDRVIYDVYLTTQN